MADPNDLRGVPRNNQLALRGAKGRAAARSRDGSGGGGSSAGPHSNEVNPMDQFNALFTTLGAHGLLAPPESPSTSFRNIAETQLDLLPDFRNEAALAAFGPERGRAFSDARTQGVAERFKLIEDLKSRELFQGKLTDLDIGAAKKLQGGKVDIVEMLGPRLAQALSGIADSGDPLAGEGRRFALEGLLGRAQAGGEPTPLEKALFEESFLRQRSATGANTRGLTSDTLLSLAMAGSGDQRERGRLLDLFNATTADRAQQPDVFSALFNQPVNPNFGITPFAGVSPSQAGALSSSLLPAAMTGRGQDINRMLGLSGLGGDIFGTQIRNLGGIEQARLGGRSSGGGSGLFTALGAIAGSVIPGIGTALGTGIGAAIDSQQ